MAEPRPVKTLLWSPFGSGEHYQGPALFTYRMYSSAPPGRAAVSLVHGHPEQERYDLFQSQHCLGDLNKGALGTTAFIRNGQRWLNEHARDFDILHGVSGYHYSLAPAFHAQKLDLPAVVFLTNHRADLADKAGWRRLVGLPRRRRKMIRELSGIIAMSQAMFDELLDYNIPERMIARIPMGVNTELFRPAASEEKAHLKSQLGWRNLSTLIFAGTIVPRKQPHLLVEALGQLKRQGYECQLVLAGPEKDPPYAERMRQRAVELGVAELIIWAGFNNNIAPLFRASELFSLPSSNEGMAAAVVEAMACGLACLVTPVSGSQDLVSDGERGRIIEPDAGHIARCWLEYLDNPETMRCHGAAATDLVEKQYSNQVVFAAYDQLFRRIIAGGDAAG